MAKEIKPQRKTLGELLRGDLTPIECLIREQVQKMYPGSQVQYGDCLKNLAVDYIAPEFPRDLCIMVDSSGSSEPYFPLICEGARQAFKAGLGDGVRRDYSVANFSRETLFSGWVPKTQYEKLEPTLTTFQGNDTVLDSDFIGNLLKRETKFAALIVTDGVIRNAGRVIPMLESMRKQGNRLGVVYLDLDNQGMNETMQQLANVALGRCLTSRDEIVPAIKSYMENKFSFAPEGN